MTNLIELAGRRARSPLGGRSGASRALSALTAGLANGLGRGLDAVLDYGERYRQRRALAAMPEYLLKDIGMSRADAERETAKPFWKA